MSDTHQTHYIEQGPNSEFLVIPPFDFEDEFTRFKNEKNEVVLGSTTVDAFLENYLTNLLFGTELIFQIFMMNSMTPEELILEVIPQLNKALSLILNIPSTYLPEPNSQEMQNFVFFQNEIDSIRYDIIELRNNRTNAHMMGEVHRRFLNIKDYFNNAILSYYRVKES